MENQENKRRSGRPRKFKDGTPNPSACRFTSREAEMIDELASDMNKTRSDIIRIALRCYYSYMKEAKKYE